MTSHRAARALIALALLAALVLYASAPALAQGSDIAWSAHRGLGINCGPSGCISGGPGCDTQAVPGQCSFPKDRARVLCSAHANCVAVTCNPSRSDCQARDTSALTPIPGFTSYVMWTHYADLAVNCSQSGCLRSGPYCDTQAVSGQCSLAKDNAIELCAEVPGCVAVNCNSQRKDCQARDTTRLDPWKGMESYIRGRATTPGAAIVRPPPAAAALSEIGQTCTNDGQCRSGNCEYHGSKGNVCAAIAPPPQRPALRDIGQTCANDGQCRSGNCEYHGSKGNVCAVPPQPAAEQCREAGRSCQSGVQCCTGMCDRNNVCVTH